MNNLFVARITNNTLGNCVAVPTQDDGIKLIVEWVRDQFHRDLTPDELFILKNDGEFYSEEDSDNITTFTLGSISNN